MKCPHCNKDTYYKHKICKFCNKEIPKEYTESFIARNSEPHIPLTPQPKRQRSSFYKTYRR